VKGAFDDREIFRCKFDIRRCEVFFKVIQLGCAWNQNRRRLLGSMRVGTLVLVLGGLAGLSGTRDLSAQQCPVIDLMPRFWHVVDDSSRESAQMQVAEFRRNLIQHHGDLYSATGVGFSSDEELNSAILRELARARANPEAMRSMGLLLKHELPTYIREFQSYFPDFRCNFPIYVLPALGKLDGAGRMINRVPSLLLGVDNAAAEYTPNTLPIFIDHELFHRYHFQVAGFSDDKGEHEILWRTLWTEGLATYASKVTNPPATLQDALILPKDLVERAEPQISALIAQLVPELDRSDPKVFAAFFEYHQSQAGVPARTGYYLGARAAEKLAGQASLFDLAHLPPAAVRGRLLDALMALQRENAAPQ
jgi:hypothetical protein